MDLIRWRPKNFGAVLAVLGAGLTVTLAVASPLAAMQKPARSDLSAESVKQYLIENPGVPLVLPVQLPVGYRWLGPSLQNQGPGPLVAARSSVFAHGQMANHPRVVVCVQSGAIDYCAGGPARIERILPSGEQVVIDFGRVSPTVSTVAFWRSVELDVLTSVPWLD